VLLQACVQHHAFTSPAVQQQEVAPHSLPSNSKDDAICLSGSHHGRGAAKTDISCDDTESSSTSTTSSSSSWDNDSDSDSSSGGGPKQPSMNRKQSASRSHRRRTGTAGQAVAPPAAAAGTSSLTSGPGAANTRRGTLTHALSSPQLTPPHLVWSQSRFSNKNITIPSALCTDVRSGCENPAGVPMQLSVVVHPTQWSVKGYVLSQQPAGLQQQQGAVASPPEQADATTAAHGVSTAAAAAAAAAAGAASASGSAQQAGANLTGDQAAAGRTMCLARRIGPFTGLMKQSSKGCWSVTQLHHSRQLCPYYTAHQVVLAERVSSS